MIILWLSDPRYKNVSPKIGKASNVHQINYLLVCAKAEIKDLTVCIVVNGEKFQSSTLTFDFDQTMPNVELV